MSKRKIPNLADITSAKITRHTINRGSNSVGFGFNDPKP